MTAIGPINILSLGGDAIDNKFINSILILLLGTFLYTKFFYHLNRTQHESSIEIRWIFKLKSHLKLRIGFQKAFLTIEQSCLLELHQPKEMQISPSQVIVSDSAASTVNVHPLRPITNTSYVSGSRISSLVLITKFRIPCRWKMSCQFLFNISLLSF